MTISIPFTQARLLVSTAYAKTIEMVEEKRDLIVAMAELLLEKEVCVLPDVPDHICEHWVFMSALVQGSLLTML